MSLGRLCSVKKAINERYRWHIVWVREIPVQSRLTVRPLPSICLPLFQNKLCKNYVKINCPGRHRHNIFSYQDSKQKPTRKWYTWYTLFPFFLILFNYAIQGKFITWLVNSALNCTWKPISHSSPRDSCDIGFQVQFNAYGAPFPPKIDLCIRYSTCCILCYLTQSDIQLCWFRGLTFRLYMVLFVFHIQYHEFGMPNWRLSATFIKRSTMQVSTFEVLFSTSKFMYSASFDILPQSIERGHRGRS